LILEKLSLLRILLFYDIFLFIPFKKLLLLILENLNGKNS